MTRMIEKTKACKYYGRHATGVVVLVNGYPHHFTGRRASADANSFIRRLKELK